MSVHATSLQDQEMATECIKTFESEVMVRIVLVISHIAKAT